MTTQIAAKLAELARLHNAVGKSGIADTDMERLARLYELSGGKAWEPPSPDYPWIVSMIEAGFLKRVDGRCGFEAFKDSHLAFTQAGLLALALRTSISELESEVSTVRAENERLRAAKAHRIERLPMVPFSERAPERDEMMGEQTILTYSEGVGVWGLEFYESGWEFPDRWFGSTHWLDISGMWPGVTAQITEFRVDAFARAEAAEAEVSKLREALTFYAESWVTTTYWLQADGQEAQFDHSEIAPEQSLLDDQGNIARAALATPEKTI